MGGQRTGLRVDVGCGEEVVVAQHKGGACHFLVREGAAGTEADDDARHAVAESECGRLALQRLCGVDVIAARIGVVASLVCRHTGLERVFVLAVTDDGGGGAVGKRIGLGVPALPVGRCGVDVCAGGRGVVHEAAVGCAVGEVFQGAVDVDENGVAVVEGAVGDGTGGGGGVAVGGVAAVGGRAVVGSVAAVDGGAEGDGFVGADGCVGGVVRAAPGEGCQRRCRHRYRRGKPQADAVPPDGFRGGMVVYLHVLLFFYFLFG